MRDIETKYLFATRTHKHYPHLSEVKEVLKFKQALTDCRSHYNMKFMLMFQLYTAVRPNEARLATWDEFDFKKGIWTIPANRMKMRKTHQVTLNKQILKALKEFKGDNATGLCFKNMRGKSFNVHSPLAVLTYMDYKSVVSPHGFRGTFATIANELRAEHGFNNDIVQACLAHETQNQVAKAYNHATYEKERAKLLGWWGDKLGDIDFKRIKKTSVYN